MILSYSLLSAVILTFGYIAYRLLMAGQSQHTLNRNCLLMIYGCCIIAPLVVLPLILNGTSESTNNGIIEIGELTGGILGTTIGNGSHSYAMNLKSIILDIYLIGACGTLLYFLFGLLMLWRIIMRGEKTDFPTFTLILVDNSCRTAPFSWGRCIVMTRKDYEEYGDLILLHEHAHRRLRHWLDIILAYGVICLQWYNPAAWAMREELKAVHEYQADELVIETGADRKEYQILLLNKAAGYGYQSLANSLNHSKLKKRITMMYKKKTSLKRRMLALAMIPAIGAGMAVTTIPSVAGVLESLAETSVAVPTETISASPLEAPEERDVFTAVEQQAEYPGGMTALMNWLAKTIRYPEAAQKADVQGRVIVKFVIEPDGSITNAEVVRGVSPELDEEALRIIREMPKWTPGKVNGNAVASYFTLPIMFRLTKVDNTGANKEAK